MISPGAMALCMENNVTISFLTGNNHFLAQVNGPQSGNVLLRRAQYRLSDDSDRCREIVRCIVAACLEVGFGQRPAADLGRCLAAPPGRATRLAPAHGLAMVQIDYDSALAERWGPDCLPPMPVL